jgi:hypothetical protein
MRESSAGLSILTPAFFLCYTVFDQSNGFDGDK